MLPDWAFRTWARAVTLACVTSIQFLVRKPVCAHKIHVYNRRIKLRLQIELDSVEPFSIQNGILGISKVSFCMVLKHKFLFSCISKIYLHLHLFLCYYKVQILLTWFKFLSEDIYDFY